MNYALLWIDALLISLLWAAALAAIVARIKYKRARTALLTFVILVPLGPLASLTASAAMAKFGFLVKTNWFAYSVSLLLAYLLGAILILRRAGSPGPESPPAAASWPRLPLVLALLTTIVVGYMVLDNMDLANQTRCALLSLKINSLYLANLPAITSDSQNAAPLYETAFARLSDDQEAKKKVHNPPFGDRRDDEFDPDEPATVAFLAHQAATITLLRQAAALPACRFDHDFRGQDFNPLLPDLNDERSAANLLHLHAREELARGHVSSAIADAAALFGMSRNLAQRPFLISFLVGLGIDGLGVKTLEESLPSVKNRDDLAVLRLDQLPSLGHLFQQAFRGEEIYGLAVYGNLSAGKLKLMNAESSQDPRNYLLMGPWTGLQGVYFRAFFLDLDAFLKLYDHLQDSATHPFYKIRGQASNVFDLFGSNDVLISILGPSLRRSFEIVARVEALDGFAQVAVAMTHYRLDHGAPPSHLDDLVPAYLDAIPIDPFDGKPLRLALKSGQWIIYSVGPDEVDDGGIPLNFHAKGDLIFTLKPPPAAPTNAP